MEQIEDKDLWESYFYPGTNVLINKLNIHDSEKLKEAEATISFEKLLELNLKPLDLNFNQNHLKKIHEYVFGEIYSFAGEYRKVNIIKRLGSFLFIKNEETISNYLDEVFKETEARLRRCYSKYDFSEALAYLYTNLIYCHPFREGNGRVIREFVREYSIAKSKEVAKEELELDWRLVDKKELNRYIEVAHVFPGATALLFNEALVKPTKTNTK